MVKPTLKPDPEKEKKEDDLKEDKLKEWGLIPAAVVIDETEKANDKKDAEAALAESDNLETDVDEARPTIVKCCACFAVFTIILIVTCTIGSFIYFHYGHSEHKWKGWCSVRYNEDDHSGEKGHHGRHHGDRGSSEEDGHNNALNPRSTGPPGGYQCGMDSEVDLDNQFERVERPEEEDCERITILHDYNVNISAYRLWKSEVCYVTWIEEEVLMNPEEFWTNMQDPEYLSQFFNELSLTYRAVLPAIPTPLHEQENGKYGEYLDGPKDYLCQGAQSYWIEKIPEEELEEYMQLVEQIMTELIALAQQYNQQQQQQQQPEYRYPMPFPRGEGGEGGEDMPEWAWGGQGDFMPMGDHGEGWPAMGDPYEGQHGGHHGGRGGHHGGRSGHHGEHGEDHGMRRRRGANKFLQKIKQHEKEAKEAKDCAAQIGNKYKQLGKSELLVSNIVPACAVEKINQRFGMKIGKKN